MHLQSNQVKENMVGIKIKINNKWFEIGFVSLLRFLSK